MPFVKSHKRKVEEANQQAIRIQDSKNPSTITVPVRNIPNTKRPMRINKYGFFETESFSKKTAQDTVTGAQISFEKIPKKVKSTRGYQYTIVVDYRGLQGYYTSGIFSKEDIEKLELSPDSGVVVKQFSNYSAANSFYNREQKLIKDLFKKKKIGVESKDASDKAIHKEDNKSI